MVTSKVANKDGTVTITTIDLYRTLDGQDHPIQGSERTMVRNRP